MKHKLGPLPLWAWTLIAGGTLGLIWYFRSAAGTAAPAPNSGTTSPVLDATAGAPPDASGGGGSSLGAASGTTLDDLYAGLMNLDTDVKTLQAQGLTDNTDTTHTWQGDFADVAGAIETLRETFGLHTDADLQSARQKARTGGVKAGKTAQKKADAGKAAAAAKKARAAQKADAAAAKKKKQGSGAAGKKNDKTPARRTQANRTPGAGGGATSPYREGTSRRNVHGGNGQHRRTARPAGRR